MTETAEAPVKKKRGRPRKNQPRVKAEAEPQQPTAASTDVLETLSDKDLFVNSSIKASGAIAINPVAYKEETKYTIWMGVTMECPYDCVHAAGKDFPRFNDIVTHDSDTNTTSRERVRGKVMDLTKTEIELVAKAVGRKVMRKSGARQWVMNADGARYSYRPTDEPLGQYLFMQVVGDSMPPNWRQTEPQSMA